MEVGLGVAVEAVATTTSLGVFPSCFIHIAVMASSTSPARSVEGLCSFRVTDADRLCPGQQCRGALFRRISGSSVSVKILRSLALDLATSSSPPGCLAVMTSCPRQSKRFVGIRQRGGCQSGCGNAPSTQPGGWRCETSQGPNYDIFNFWGCLVLLVCG